MVGTDDRNKEKITTFELEDVEEVNDDQKNEKIINEGDEETKEKEEKEK